MKLSLAIIAKDETKQLDRIVKDYGQYFDEIVIAYDSEPIYKNDNPKVKVVPYKWINDFAHKRNFLEKHITSEYYFRLDTDDAILNPGKIKGVAKRAKEEGVSIVYCYYDYAKDENGVTCASHWRETIIKKDWNLYWNKPIHENIIAKDMRSHKIVLEDLIRIDHLIDFEHSMKSSMRNIKYLLDEYKRDGENTDPRTIAYLGRMLLGIEEYDKARFFLEKHIQASGWDEDRYSSWCSLVDVHLKKKDYATAKAAAFEALAERADYPDAYLKLHDVYFQQEQWQKAIDWGEQGLQKPEPKTFILRDPSASGWRPTLSMSFCYFKLGDFKRANKLFQIVEKQAPNLPFVKANKKLYEEAAMHNDYMEKFMWVARVLEMSKEREKIKHLIYSVPKALDNHEIITKMKQVYLPSKTWGKKSIVIFAGSCNEEWTPNNIADGIGGSEEAIIYISREFKKLGYNVTVYNNCGDKEGNYDGVEYADYYKFNPADNFNIIISWRNNIFTNGVQGARKILWLHDLPNNIRWDDDTVKTFDKVVVLSDYHKSTLPEVVPVEKIYVSTNGIVPEDFIGLEKVKKIPKRIIYASSYNRGLDKILTNWEEIRKEVPEAEIHCYYGWEVYDQYVKSGAIKDSGFKPKMLKLFAQEGVYEHGRIGHKELLQEYAKSGVFAYPCVYKGEINCISLTKAIACECNVVTNKYAVMAERSPNAVDDDKFIAELIRILKEEEKPVINTGYIDSMSWKLVAMDWEKNIFKGDIETISGSRVGWIREQCKQDTDKIIDIGCAEGHLFDGWNRDRITCVDLDEHKIPNFIKGNAEDLPVTDHYDVAVLGEILEHLDSPQKAVKEALRVADKVVITVPYEYEWREFTQPFQGIKEKEKETGMTREEILKKEDKIPLGKFDKSDNYEHLWHKRFYTPDTLKKELEEAGAVNFQIIKIRGGDWCHLGAVINESIC